jgi:hypothetical protein
MNVLTLEGLRGLLELAKQGKEPPSNWREDVTEYLRLKRRMVEMFGRRWDKEQLTEAELIAWDLKRRNPHDR